MDTSKAMAKARRLPFPRNRSEFVRCAPIEVALAFMKLHHVKKVRFMGDLLVIEEREAPTPLPAASPHLGEHKMGGEEGK